MRVLSWLRTFLDVAIHSWRRSFVLLPTRRVTFAAIGMALVATSSWAFEQDEHRQISMDALRLALDQYSSCDWLETDLSQLKTCLAALPLSDKDLLNLQRLLGAKGSPNFGDLVAYVDFALDPVKLVEASGNTMSFPHDFGDLNEDFLGRLRERPTLHLLASKNNDAHFQQQMRRLPWREKAEERPAPRLAARLAGRW